MIFVWKWQIFWQYWEFPTLVRMVFIIWSDNVIISFLTLDMGWCLFYEIILQIGETWSKNLYRKEVEKKHIIYLYTVLIQNHYWITLLTYVLIRFFFIIYSLLQNIFMYWQSKVTSGHRISFQKIFKSNTFCKTFMRPTTKEEVVQNLCNKRLDDCDQRKSFEFFIHTSELSSTSSLSLLGLELQSWEIRDRNRGSIPVNVTENLKNTTS